MGSGRLSAASGFAYDSSLNATHFRRTEAKHILQQQTKSFFILSYYYLYFDLNVQPGFHTGNTVKYGELAGVSGFPIL